MSDEPELGPDPNDVRRHAKSMLTEQQYREKYCRLDFYKPNNKQKEFHDALALERLLRAMSQGGKSTASSAELAMHATRRYAAWWKGRTFLTKPPIERPMDFLAYVAAPTGQKVRDGMQSRLLGNIGSSGGLGQGYIPLDCIVGRPAMARGIADEVDSVTIRRQDGGEAVIRFKTYAQGRQAYEGESCDVICLDEDIKGEDNEAIYTECLARGTAVSGIIQVSMTPLLGTTFIRRRFKENAGSDPNIVEILMTIDDCVQSAGGHIPDDQIEVLKRKYKASQLQTRLYGADAMGEGLIFETPTEQIKAQFNEREFPAYYRWLWALDFRHSGSEKSGHPFAALLAAHDPNTDTIYIVHGFKMLGLPESHAAKIKAHRYWRAPTVCPHDVGRAASIVSGETIGAVYKKLGLHILPGHATFPDGSYNFEAGLTEMETRFSQGRLVVASNLTGFFDEYTSFHRLSGLPQKINDDLLSCCRLICMAIRHARRPEVFENFGANPLSRDPRTRFARGSMNHPDGPYDLFRV